MKSSLAYNECEEFQQTYGKSHASLVVLFVFNIYSAHG